MKLASQNCRRLVIVALLTPMIASCKTSGGGSPSQTDYHLSRDCEDLAKRVEPPVTKGLLPAVALPRMAGALGKANNNLDATRECQVDQRERLAGDR